MTVDEKDPAVVRIRHESAAVRVGGPGVDAVLRRVHERRRVQRQHRAQAFAALSVVFVAVAGAVLVNQESRTPDLITPVAVRPVSEWPLRGSLSGDRDLLARAETTWRQSPHRPSGAVRALYAGGPSDYGTANYAVVALASAEGSVAFVTTPAQATIDTSTLLLRSVSTVTPDQPAIGFVAVRPDPLDEVAGIAFALAAPGAPSPGVRSSAVDYQFGGKPARPDGAVWEQVPSVVGAWNTYLDLGAYGRVAPAAGVADPATGPVRLRRASAGLVAEGASVGDLIVTADGVLGVVTSAGLVDTRLSALGPVEVAISGVPGTLTDSGEFSAPAPVNPGNRIVLVRGDVTVTVGRLADDGPPWLLDRAVDPADAPETARRVSLP